MFVHVHIDFQSNRVNFDEFVTTPPGCSQNGPFGVAPHMALAVRYVKI